MTIHRLPSFDSIYEYLLEHPQTSPSRHQEYTSDFLKHISSEASLRNNNRLLMALCQSIFHPRGPFVLTQSRYAIALSTGLVACWCERKASFSEEEILHALHYFHMTDPNLHPELAQLDQKVASLFRGTRLNDIMSNEFGLIELFNKAQEIVEEDQTTAKEILTKHFKSIHSALQECAHAYASRSRL